MKRYTNVCHLRKRLIRMKNKELTENDFKKAEEALKKANVPPPRAIVAP